MLHEAKEFTAAVIVGAPILLILYDVAAYLIFGDAATITEVVRDWNEVSAWPLAIFVLGAVALYLHLFRDWL